jgi:hypothetical protein
MRIVMVAEVGVFSQGERTNASNLEPSDDWEPGWKEIHHDENRWRILNDL